MAGSARPTLRRLYGGQCPPYGAAIVGRALPAGSLAPPQAVIKRQSKKGEDA